MLKIKDCRVQLSLLKVETPCLKQRKKIGLIYVDVIWFVVKIMFMLTLNNKSAIHWGSRGR